MSDPDVVRTERRGGKLFRRVTVEPVRASLADIGRAPAKESFEFTSTLGGALVSALGAFYPSLAANGAAEGLRALSL
jgi:hypothetical protein